MAKQARTKYFGEGVRAETWTTGRPPQWSVVIAREEGSLYFLKLDDLRRRVWWLKQQIERGEKRPWISGPDLGDPDFEFRDAESAWACIVAIGAAVAYIREIGQDEDWIDPPADLFTAEPWTVSALSDAEVTRSTLT